MHGLFVPFCGNLCIVCVCHFHQGIPDTGTSKLLAGLLDQRNEAYLYEKPEEDVFDAKPEEPPAKKVKRKHFPNTVKIQVESQEVEVFMDGQRPTRSPLTVAMVPEQMQAIFNHLQKDLEAK